VIRETVLAAVVAGLIAALVFTVVQSVWVTPLILQGEVYEDAAEAAPHSHVHEGHIVAADAASHHDNEPIVGADALDGATHDADEHHESGTRDAAEHHHDEGHEAAAGGHHHDENEWKPEDGWQRTLFTFGANLLMGVGYAFVLVALYLLWRQPRNLLGGALYGVAGFLVFFAAPALGLPPELPGTAAAELSVRQEWWAMTAAATAIGLFLVFSQNNWGMRILGIAIVIAPHFVPAPQPVVESSLAPAELQSQFRVATTVANAAFWLALGVASAVMFRKLVTTGSQSPA
jgi:cobalt transporter subunit CbtA